MAAGLSIEEKNIEAFRRRLNDNCFLTADDLIPKIVIDVPMPVSYITKNLVNQLSLLEPFGKGNTKPLFAQKGMRVLNLRILGKNRNAAKVQIMDNQGNVMDGIYFGEAESFQKYVGQKDTISITYYPGINHYQGRENLQIIIQNYC